MLDSYAVLAFLFREKGHDQVYALFEKAIDADKKLLISAPNWAEVRYVIERKVGVLKWKEVRTRLLGLPIDIVSADHEMAELAGEIRVAGRDAFTPRVATLGHPVDRHRDDDVVRDGLAVRAINHLSGNLSYSLSFAQGTGSVSQTQRNIAWVGTETPKQTAPLDFDQRHKFSLNLDYRFGAGEGPLWGGRRWLQNSGINALLNVASGTPFTPTKVYNEVTLAAVATEPSGPLNSRYGPWNVNLDLKASREFALRGFRIEAYVWALNVFDNRNPTAVYTSTGIPTSTNWLNTDDGQAFLANTGDEGLRRYELLKSSRPAPLTSSDPELDEVLNHRWLKPVAADVPPLTDDYAPVDRYLTTLK